MASSVTFDLFARDHASGAFTKVGQAAEKTSRSVGGMTRSFGAVTAGSRGLRTSFGLIGKGAALAAGAAGIGGLVAAFKGVYSEAREAQKTSAQTAAVIKSTGGVAKVSAQQVGDLATAISNKVGVDDEAIQSGANLLLTFTGIRNEAGKGNQIFDRATQTITDMAAAMNNGQVTTQGLKTASIQVGKALQDPIKGVTALRKVGVSLTDAQQKQIASLVAHGHALDAQKIILGELNKEFGGSAAAGTNAMQKLGVIFGNIKEQVGTALLPAIDAVANWLGTRLPGAVATAQRFIGLAVTGIKALAAAFQEGDVTSDGFVGVMERIGVALRNVWGFAQQNVLPVLQRMGTFVSQNRELLGYLAAGIGAVAVALKVFRGIMLAVNLVMSANPIGLVVVALGLLVGAVVYAYKHSERFRNIVDAVWAAAKQLWGFLYANLSPIFQALGQLIVTRIWPALQGLFVRFQQVWPTVQRVIVFVGTLIGILAKLVITVLGKVIPILIRLAGPIFTLLFAAIGKIIGIAAALARGFIAATATVIRVFLAMVGAILTGAAKAFGWVPGIGGKLKKASAEFNKFRDQVNNALNGVHDKNVTVTAKASVLMGQGLSRSDAIATSLHRAAGGPIFGPGTRTSDSIPIMASNDEHMWSAREVAGAGGHGAVARLRKYAAAGQLAGFAAGGPVQFNVLARNSGMPQFRTDVAAVNRFATDLVTGAASRAARSAASSFAAGAPTSVSGNAALGRLLAAQLYGWTGGQWNALYALGQRESGWRNTAQNPTSTAYGIGQFLNSTWASVGMTKTSDARLQIIGMLRYIAGRYGSPAAAWAHETSAGWYGSGMAPTVFSRPTLIGVGERGPETVSVIPHRGGRGPSEAGVVINVNVSGVVGDRQAVVGWVKDGLKKSLRSGGRADLANAFG